MVRFDAVGGDLFHVLMTFVESSSDRMVSMRHHRTSEFVK